MVNTSATNLRVETVVIIVGAYKLFDFVEMLQSFLWDPKNDFILELIRAYKDRVY